MFRVAEGVVVSRQVFHVKFFTQLLCAVHFATQRSKDAKPCLCVAFKLFIALLRYTFVKAIRL